MRLRTAMSPPEHFARDRVENSNREKREPNNQQAGNRATIKCHAQSFRARFRRGLCGAHIRENGDAHSDKAGGERTGGADDETDSGRDDL